MASLRLETLPRIPLPPPYQLGLSDVDGLPVLRAELRYEIRPPSADLVDEETRRKAEARKAAIDAYEGMHQQLVSLVEEGLHPDGREWINYWSTEDRLDTFRDMVDSLRRQERKVQEFEPDAFAPAEEYALACREQIKRLWPQAEPVIAFAEQVLLRSFKIAGHLVRSPLEGVLREKDASHAANFNWATSWALVALNTFLVAAELDEEGKLDGDIVTDDLLGTVLAAARHFSLEANHAVREGQRLRTEVQPAPTKVSEQHDSAGVIDGREEMIDDSDLQDVEDAIVLEEARRGG